MTLKMITKGTYDVTLPSMINYSQVVHSLPTGNPQTQVHPNARMFTRMRGFGNRFPVICLSHDEIGIDKRSGSRARAWAGRR